MQPVAGVGVKEGTHKSLNREQLVTREMGEKDLWFVERRGWWNGIERGQEQLGRETTEMECVIMLVLRACDIKSESGI